jgi:four helix bundle protein
MELEDLRIYSLAMEISEQIWKVVSDWNYLARDTVGKQWVRSADSIAANISEGFGRYHYKENKQFLFYARGSLYETKTWLKKATNRGLVPDEISQRLLAQLNQLGPQLNSYIKSIGSASANTVKEGESLYDFEPPCIYDSMSNDQ